MTIARSLEELVGGTPLLALSRLGAGLPGELLAKLEMANPLGSDKDRLAATLLAEATRAGMLRPGGVIVEATSGNFAFSLAAFAVPRGYRVVLVMPEGVPGWRVALLRALGAEVELTPTALGMRGAANRAAELTDTLGAFQPDLFATPLGAAAMEACADEIWEACEGRVGAFVAAVATGHTVTGVGRRLKALSSGATRIVAVEPASSPVLSGGEPGAHRLLGMGPPFAPPGYDASVVDEVIAVEDEQCYATLLRLYRQEGLPSGPAGAAAVAAALAVAARPEMAGQRVVALLPDGMDRYSEMGFWSSFDRRVNISIGEL